MTDGSIYQKQQTPKEYELCYGGKYKRIDEIEKQLITRLLLQFRDAKSLLEVGCGTGHFTNWINALGIESTGIDLSLPMLYEAKAHWKNNRLLQSEASYLPFKDKSVDLVAFITSIEYLPDLSASLIEAARVARKGLIFGLMNKNSISTLKKRLNTLTNQDSYYKNAHFYSFTDIKNALTQSLQKDYCIVSWSTTVFPKALDGLESSRFPFGAFLGIAVEIRND